ncbi:MAG: hypothetical protein PHF51_05705, partial [Candidatus ainarchaeum sp.]|nr:hypothetical protein [Candidatus ainarchaeum sp.]
MDAQPKKLIAFLLLLACASALSGALSFTPYIVLNGTGQPGAESLFESPMGLFVDSAGRLYVADSGADAVFVFAPDLTYLAMRGGTDGSGPTELSAPEGVWVDAGGKVYIADTLNNRIQIYTDYSGNYLKTVPTGAGESYALSNPGGVAVDSLGNLHVPDRGHNRVTVFSPAGAFIKSVYSAEPFGEYVFNSPGAIWIDSPRNRILVTDTENDRVQVFSDNYTFITRLGWGSGALGFSRPGDTTVDPSGKIYIADTANNRVQVFAPDYSFLASIRGADYNFSGPIGVAAITGRVFISDPGGSKVVVLSVNSSSGGSYEEGLVAAAASEVTAARAAYIAASLAVNATIANAGECSGLAEASRLANQSGTNADAAEAALSRARAALAAHPENVSVETASANAFASQAETLAESALSYARAFNETAGGAVVALNLAKAGIEEAGSLRAYAPIYGVSSGNASQVLLASSLYEDARVHCSAGSYPEAESLAKMASGNASLALAPLRQAYASAITLRLQNYSARISAAKANSTLYGAAINFAAVDREFLLANVSFQAARYVNASQALDSVESGLSSIEAQLLSRAGTFEALKSTIAAGILEAAARATEMKAQEGNYSQASGAEAINSLLSLAQGNLSTGRLADANNSLAQAVSLIESENASLQLKIAEIEAVRAEMNSAREAVLRARSASLPLLSADVSSAEADLTEAEAILNTDPEGARLLALSAGEKAAAEEARVNGLKGGYFIVVILLLALAAFGFFIIAGTAA